MAHLRRSCAPTPNRNPPRSPSRWRTESQMMQFESLPNLFDPKDLHIVFLPLLCFFFKPPKKSTVKKVISHHLSFLSGERRGPFAPGRFVRSLLTRCSPTQIYAYIDEATGLIRAQAMDPFHEVKALACRFGGTQPEMGWLLGSKKKGVVFWRKEPGNFIL